MLMMTERKNLQTYLETFAEDRYHVRVLLDWRGNKQYSETVDGVLVDIGDDYLTLDREISDFEKEKYGGIYVVHVIIPLTRVVKVMSFFSTTEK